MTIFSDTTIRMMRFVGWGLVALILIAPMVAMQMDAEGVDWGAEDFIIIGALLGGVGLTLELAVRRTRNAAYLIGVGAALMTALLTIWANLAVGIIGDGGHAANLLFFAVVLFAVIGALAVKFEAAGLAKVMTLTGVAQAAMLATAIAMETEMVAILFIAASVLGWLFSGQGFRVAARQD